MQRELVKASLRGDSAVHGWRIPLLLHPMPRRSAAPVSAQAMLLAGFERKFGAMRRANAAAGGGRGAVAATVKAGMGSPLSPFSP